ncbi:hypothetical protein LJR130_000325 [Variovorax sp. LjRoot130]
MSLSLVQSRALLGLEAASVTVEVHLANGLPSFTLVGLTDVKVKEARRSEAIKSVGCFVSPPPRRSGVKGHQKRLESKATMQD